MRSAWPQARRLQRRGAAGVNGRGETVSMRERYLYRLSPESRPRPARGAVILEMQIGETMSSDAILSDLREIMIDVFDVDDLDLTMATTAEDVEEWDSLSHVRLVVAVERRFGFRFTTSEIEKLATVGDLVTLIQAKSAG